MKLVTINGATNRVGALTTSGEVLDLGRAARDGTAEVWLPSTMRGVLEAGDEGLAIARRIVDRIANASAQQLAALRASLALLPPSTSLAAPVPQPRLVVAAGLAYKSHLAEMSGTPQPPHPTAFMKTPHSIASPEAIVTLPPNADTMVDYEGELALVFGRRCHRVAPQEAMSYIAGCTVANDISARNWVEEVWSASAPWDARRTWEVNIMGKQFPGFTPLGPSLLTMDEITDIGAMHLTTRLNGQVVQSADISDLIFDLGETIAFLSRWYEFHPGDVLLTGTPAGVGVGRKPRLFMKHGDVVEVEIDRIGVLRNTLQADSVVVA